MIEIPPAKIHAKIARIPRIGWLPLLLAFSTLLSGSLGAGAFPFPKNSSFKDVWIPICADGEQRPCAYLEVESLYHDYQTRGFFRIGFLPGLRAEKVEVVMTAPEHFRDVLAEVRALFLPRGSRRSFEMFEVSISVEGEPAPRLVAPRVRLTESGGWDLVDGCQLQQEGEPRDLPRSRLTVAGPEAGTLHTSFDGRLRTFRLFETSETKEDQSE